MFHCALNASQKAFGEDMKIAQQQNFFATHVLRPKAFNAFLKYESVPNNAKTTVP